MDNRYEDWIQRVEKKIRKICPVCNIEWFYDQNNLQKAGNQLFEDYIANLLKCLCAHDPNLYIRIHWYKSWCVLRIAMRNCLPKKVIVQLKRELLNNDSVHLFDITYQNRKIIIKMALYRVS